MPTEKPPDMQPPGDQEPASGSESEPVPERALLREPGKPEKEVEIIGRHPPEKVLGDRWPTDFLERGHLVTYRDDTGAEIVVPSTDIFPLETAAPLPDASLSGPTQEEATVKADEVPAELMPEQQTQPAGPSEAEAIQDMPTAAEEKPFPYLEGLHESVSGSESKTAELEQALQRSKAKAKELIDANDFANVSGHLREAEDTYSRLEREQKQLAHLQARVRTVEDLIGPANILDLKAEYERQLSQEKDRRARLQDNEPVDSYAAMLKENLINKYVQTGADPEEPRVFPEEVIQRIENLIAESYEELESRLPKSAVELAPQEPPEDEPDAPPADDPPAPEPVEPPPPLPGENSPPASGGKEDEPPADNDEATDTGEPADDAAAEDEQTKKLLSRVFDRIRLKRAEYLNPDDVPEPRLPFRALDKDIREKLKQYSPKKRTAVIGSGLLVASVLAPVGITAAVVYRAGLSADSFSSWRYSRELEKAKEHQKAAAVQQRIADTAA